MTNFLPVSIKYVRKSNSIFLVILEKKQSICLTCSIKISFNINIEFRNDEVI